MKNLVWNVGDVCITRIVECEEKWSIADLLPAADVRSLERHRDWLVPDFLDEHNRCAISYHSLVLESCGLVILVDTCIGEHEIPYESDLKVPEGYLATLELAGFSREGVDVVLCTHMHFDHVGWNTIRMGDDWVPTFPNARYLFAEAEYEYWNAQSDKSVASSFPETVQPLLAAGLADIVSSTHRITDEVTLIPTPGHTPGHVSVAIESCHGRALITGDMTHHPVQWAEPSWGTVADCDGEQAVRTRQCLLESYLDSSALVIGSHYPDPTAGRLVSVGGEVEFRTSSNCDAT